MRNYCSIHESSRTIPQRLEQLDCVAGQCLLALLCGEWFASRSRSIIDKLSTWYSVLF